VAGKNLRLLDGRPLLGYALDCAAQTPEVGHVAVSTDSEEIRAVAAELGFPTPYLRPLELATDAAAKIDAIRHVTAWTAETLGFEADLVVDLDVGVPLRLPEDVSGAIASLERDATLDALVTVYPAERSPYFNMVEAKGDGSFVLVKRPPEPVLRRQDAPPVFSITPAVFAWRRHSMHVRHLFEGRWGIHPMPIERGIDIDTEHELKLVQYLVAERSSR